MRAGANVVDVRTLDPGYHKVRTLAVHLVLDAEEAIVDDGSMTAFNVKQTAIHERYHEKEWDSFRQSRVLARRFGSITAYKTRVE